MVSPKVPPHLYVFLGAISPDRNGTSSTYGSNMVFSTSINRSLLFLARNFTGVASRPMFMLVLRHFLKRPTFPFLVPAPPG
jgi:hypothetical protein